MSGHWAYIAGAYGVGLLVLAVEVALLWRRARHLEARPRAQGGEDHET